MIIKICFCSIELSDIQETEEEDLPEGGNYVTKTDRLMKSMKGKLVGIDSTIAFEIPSIPGMFVSFKNCFIVYHPGVPCLIDEHSVSGLFKTKLNQQQKIKKQPLGIAFAMFKRTRRTVFCDMKQVFENFRVFVSK